MSGEAQLPTAFRPLAGKGFARDGASHAEGQRHTQWSAQENGQHQNPIQDLNITTSASAEAQNTSFTAPNGFRGPIPQQQPTGQMLPTFMDMTRGDSWMAFDQQAAPPANGAAPRIPNTYLDMLRHMSANLPPIEQMLANDQKPVQDGQQPAGAPGAFSLAQGGPPFQADMQQYLQLMMAGQQQPPAPSHNAAQAAQTIMANFMAQQSKSLQGQSGSGPQLTQQQRAAGVLNKLQNFQAQQQQQQQQQSQLGAPTNLNDITQLMRAQQNVAAGHAPESATGQPNQPGSRVLTQAPGPVPPAPAQGNMTNDNAQLMMTFMRQLQSSMQGNVAAAQAAVLPPAPAQGSGLGLSPQQLAYMMPMMQMVQQGQVPASLAQTFMTNVLNMPGQQLQQAGQVPSSAAAPVPPVQSSLDSSMMHLLRARSTGQGSLPPLTGPGAPTPQAQSAQPTPAVKAPAPPQHPLENAMRMFFQGAPQAQQSFTQQQQPQQQQQQGPSGAPEQLWALFSAFMMALQVPGGPTGPQAHGARQALEDALTHFLQHCSWALPVVDKAVARAKVASVNPTQVQPMVPPLQPGSSMLPGAGAGAMPGALQGFLQASLLSQANNFAAMARQPDQASGKIEPSAATPTATANKAKGPVQGLQAPNMTSSGPLPAMSFPAFASYYKLYCQQVKPTTVQTVEEAYQNYINMSQMQPLATDLPVKAPSTGLPANIAPAQPKSPDCRTDPSAQAEDAEELSAQLLMQFARNSHKGPLPPLQDVSRKGPRSKRTRAEGFALDDPTPCHLNGADHRETTPSKAGTADEDEYGPAGVDKAGRGARLGKRVKVEGTGAARCSRAAGHAPVDEEWAESDGGSEDSGTGGRRPSHRRRKPTAGTAQRRARGQLGAPGSVDREGNASELNGSDSSDDERPGVVGGLRPRDRDRDRERSPVDPPSQVRKSLPVKVPLPNGETYAQLRMKEVQTDDGVEIPYIINNKGNSVNIIYYSWLLKQNFFQYTMEQAANRLKVGNTTLKKACRKIGLTRWPYRKATAQDEDKRKEVYQLPNKNGPLAIPISPRETGEGPAIGSLPSGTADSAAQAAPTPLNGAMQSLLAGFPPMPGVASSHFDPLQLFMHMATAQTQRLMLPTLTNSSLPLVPTHMPAAAAPGPTPAPAPAAVNGTAVSGLEGQSSDGIKHQASAEARLEQESLALPSSDREATPGARQQSAQPEGGDNAPGLNVLQRPAIQGEAVMQQGADSDSEPYSTSPSRSAASASSEGQAGEDRDASGAPQGVLMAADAAHEGAAADMEEDAVNCGA